MVADRDFFEWAGERHRWGTDAVAEQEIGAAGCRGTERVFGGPAVIATGDGGPAVGASAATPAGAATASAGPRAVLPRAAADASGAARAATGGGPTPPGVTTPLPQLGDSPTAPMPRRRPRPDTASTGPVPVSPVGASAGGLVGQPPRSGLLTPGRVAASVRRAVRLGSAGRAAGVTREAPPHQAATLVSFPRAGAPAGWPAARSRPAGPPGPLAAAAAAVMGGLGVLAWLGGRGWTGAAVGWATFVAASVLAVAALCLLSPRARPMLSRLGGCDELTGLVGRHAFLEAAARVVGGGEHRVREVAPVALVLVDLDRFREINGVLGHQNGDRLLVVVARRLRALLRPSDLLARIGGDEFAVLLRDAGPGRAELLASRLRDALRAPVLLADLPVQTEVSVGIAYAPAHGRSAAELLRHAEAAMYEAKQTRAGQRTYQRNRDAPTVPGRARLRLRAELRSALENGQIELRYQPKADPRTGRVAGVEALVRWQHPREGLRGPGVFLPEMEQAGLMPALTRHVLELALADCASWQKAGAELSVSVNVPPSVIDDTGFAATVGDALRRHALKPTALVVEVTEEALITVREQARRTLTELRALGVRVSLDDYGTGFCSLAYLRELPADEVKLDQMFLRDMHRDASAAEIVRSTVALAHALDLKIVAEGVETKGAWLALATWRCDEVQGYFVSPPLAGGRVVAWLDDWARRVSRHSQSQQARPVERASARLTSTKGAKAKPAPARLVQETTAAPGTIARGEHASSQPTEGQRAQTDLPGGPSGERPERGTVAQRANARVAAGLVPAQPSARATAAARSGGHCPRVNPRG